MYKVYKKSLTARQLNFILYANTCLAAQHSINQYTITGLIRAFKKEKKKQSYKKQLNLVREEDNRLQFFSLIKVYCAKAYLEEKEAQERAKQDRIENKKASALANRICKEEEKAARALQVFICKEEAVQKKL